MTRKPPIVIDQSDAKWHVDRKVPVALIVTIFLMFAGQTGTALVWASKMDSRVEHLEKQSTMSAPQGDRLTRVEVKLETALDNLAEIKSILRKEPSLPKTR